VAVESELTLAKPIGTLLRERGLTLAVAEGTTGGRIGERLVRFAGASAFFKGALVTYDYRSRVALLGIAEEDMRRDGAVSEPHVRSMARAVRERFAAGIGLASSGVAGPAGKDVGLVWLAVALPDRAITREHRLAVAPRARLQAEFTRLALMLLRDVLMER
jgi:nicotinamide-nucleotide amidase